MEMEDHHHHHHHNHHGNQYGLTDLRHLISSVGGGERGAPAGMLVPGVQTQPFPQPFEPMMMMGTYQHGPIRNEHGVSAVLPTSSLGGGDGGDGGTGRWPRQETLTLLEIRSRLDSKFKEANQKGPLWDEVSRIMSEEHSYQRSGKKCREKFENLYKYYKKTKEGKAGRQDGKHYRFFRQLEALYGEPSTNTGSNIQVSAQDYSMANNLGFHNLSSVPNTADLSHLEGYNVKNSDSLSLSNNSSEFESSSSEGNESSGKMKRNRARGGWKARIKEFIDSQMRKLMEKQEAWLEKLMRTLEQKEKERGLREEEWRRQEAARLEHEHEFWAKERAWIEARDSALMEALKSYKAIDQNASSLPQLGLNPSNVDDRDGSEIHENVNVQASNRGELVARRPDHWPIEDLGYDRSGLVCGERWERNINRLSSKKRKENLRDDRCGNYGNTFENESNATSLYNHGGYNNVHCDQMNDGTTSSSPNSNANHGVNHDHSCFPFLMGEGSDNLWDNYSLKLNKGG